MKDEIKENVGQQLLDGEKKMRGNECAAAAKCVVEDDGFESLNSNGSSENGEENQDTVRGDQISSDEDGSGSSSSSSNTINGCKGKKESKEEGKEYVGGEGVENRKDGGNDGTLLSNSNSRDVTGNINELSYQVLRRPQTTSKSLKTPFFKTI